MDFLNITVAICTYNRGTDIAESILSVLNQDYPDFELIIVDNNSTDNTREIIREIKSNSEKPFTYVLEEKSGLSHARNKAIELANGEILVYLDDDAVPHDKWLHEINRVFQNNNVGVVGGKINPKWESQEPDWIPDAFKGSYTILDYSNEIKEMSFPDTPYGANMAFRLELLKSHNGFRTDLGRVGSNLLSNEESELINRIRNQYKVMYSPFIIVDHKIPKSRATKKWFLRRLYWAGVSENFEQRRPAIRSIAKIVIAFIQLAFSANKKQRMYHLARVAHGYGSLKPITKK